MTQVIQLIYSAKVQKEADGFIVSFRDFPNVFSEGDSLKEALLNAQEALDGVLLEMTRGEYKIKSPSRSRAREYPIQVSPEIAAPILLHILRQRRAKTLTQVAHSLRVPYQQYQRLEHNCNMTLKSLKKAAAAMGGKVEIVVHMEG